MKGGALRHVESEWLLTNLGQYWTRWVFCFLNIGRKLLILLVSPEGFEPSTY